MSFNVNSLQKQQCLAMLGTDTETRLQLASMPLYPLFALHTRKEYCTYAPLGSMDGLLQWKWEDMSTRSIPSVLMSFQKRINNSWEDQGEIIKSNAPQSDTV